MSSYRLEIWGIRARTYVRTALRVVGALLVVFGGWNALLRREALMYDLFTNSPILELVRAPGIPWFSVRSSFWIIGVGLVIAFLIPRVIGRP